MNNDRLSCRAAYHLMFREYPDVVGIEQMCEMLGGISTKTGYKMLREKKIKSYKIGRTYKIPKINIIMYLNVLKKSPAQECAL